MRTPFFMFLPHPWHVPALAFSLLVAVVLPLLAVEDEVAAQQRAAAGQVAPTKGSQMIYGPVLACSVQAPAGSGPREVAAKGLVIRLGENDEGCLCFDTDTLRLSAAWLGGFLNFKDTNIGGYKGERFGAAEIVGKMQFRTADGPGWSRDESFADPRAEKAGPLPGERGRFKGIYLHGNRVVLSYEVEGCAMLESAEMANLDQLPIFIRRFTIGPSKAPLHLRNPTGEGLHFSVLCEFSNPDAQPVRADGAGNLNIPAHTDSWNLAVVYSPSREDDPRIAQIVGKPIDLTTFTKSGPARWPQTFKKKGALAKEEAAYVVDTIPLPVDNPWKSWMRVSAFDFFSDGRAAVATFNGDVWIVSGLDDRLENVSWKRFAVGLYEPLGLKIVGDVVHVRGRDQITRLHDLNGDGEADFYECFNNDRTLYPSYHAFVFDLQTDSKGNFYYVVGGNQLGAKRDWHAALFRVSPDGSKTESVATGFRAPNGLGIGPHDEIAVSDNQGHWIPSSKINLVKPGGFYGHVADPRVDAKAVAPASFDAPLCWIPMTLDNSSGGEVWVTGGKWGPFEGHMLHTSYGKSALLAVLDETVDGVAQGGVVSFPLKFGSGIMRARFNPKDGQLYVAGLRGWQTNAAIDGCFQRVRYTGQPVALPTGLHVSKDAIAITFPIALDPASAGDAGNFSIEQYNYQWWSTYGSPDLSLANAPAKGRDPVEISAARLSADGKTVTLAIPGLRPVMQMEIKLRLRSADGAEIRTVIGNTIHQIPRD